MGRPRGGFRDCNYKNLLALPCLKRGPEAGDHRNIIDFHVSGVNSPSCAFQQNHLPARYSGNKIILKYILREPLPGKFSSVHNSNFFQK